MRNSQVIKSVFMMTSIVLFVISVFVDNVKCGDELNSVDNIRRHYQGSKLNKRNHNDTQGLHSRKLNTDVKDRKGLRQGKKLKPMPPIKRNKVKIQTLIQRSDTGDLPPELEELSPFSITQYLTSLASKLESQAHIQIEVLGKTVQRLDITMMKLTGKDSSKETFRTQNEQVLEDVKEKKIIFIVHGLSVLGMRDFPVFLKQDFEIVLGYYMEYLNKFDIYLIPMANPDGVSVSEKGFSSNKLWDKNLSPQSECFGVNLDRNFDVHWTASTKSACSMYYPGPEAFSEAETKAIREVFHKYGHKMVAYMNLHPSSYSSDATKGDAVLYPKGYENLSDEDRYIDLKGEIEESMRNTSFRYLNVRVDTLYNWYGKVTGTSVDYAATAYGIPYSLELLMQVYADQYDASEIPHKKHYHYIALTELWRRIYDVIFNTIYNNLDGNKNNNEKRK